VTHEIELAEGARVDAERISTFHVRTIFSMARIHLAREPLTVTRMKKPLRIEHAPLQFRDLIRDFLREDTGADPWELRVGRWRAIYVLVGHPAAVRILRLFEKPEHVDMMTALLRWDGLD
jgi:hypothetical protein